MMGGLSGLDFHGWDMSTIHAQERKKTNMSFCPKTFTMTEDQSESCWEKCKKESTDGAPKEKGGPWAPKKKGIFIFLFYEKWRWVPCIVRYKFFAWWRKGVWNASWVGSLDDLFFVVFGSLGLRDLPFMFEDQCSNFRWCMLDHSFYFQ